MLLLPGLAESVERTSSAHVHHWRIAEQSGARSVGRCDCGVERAFRNSWDGDSDLRLHPGSWATRRQREARGDR